MTKHWFELGATLHETPPENETEEEAQAKLAFINLLEYLAEEGECPVSTLEGALPLPPPIKLNPGQQAALDRWIEFLKGDGLVFALQGAAGTGKTFTAKKLLKAVGNQTHAILAPTHAARKLHGKDAMTVAKALGMKPGKGETGEMIFQSKDEKGRQKEDPLADVKFVLLDEAGMVDDDQLNQLIAKVKQNGGKLICLGDEYQLPPVNKEGRISSPAFDRADDGFTLTQSMRNQGATLLYASALRENMKEVICRASEVGVEINEGSPVTIPALVPNGEEIIELGARDWRNHAIEFFKQNDDPFAGRVLFYRNKNVQDFNTLCQQAVYGSPIWQVGQKVVTYKPVCRLDEETKAGRNGGTFTKVETVIYADNSEVLTVVGEPRITTYNESALWWLEKELTANLFGDVEITLVPTVNEAGLMVELRIPTAKGNEQISKVTGAWKGGKKVKGLIDLFWEARKGKGTMPSQFIGMDHRDVGSAKYEGENIVFDYAQPYWACTVHKAQGCTISSNLYLDVNDILAPSKWNKQFLAAKLMYTAITRAKGQVYIPRV